MALEWIERKERDWTPPLLSGCCPILTAAAFYGLVDRKVAHLVETEDKSVRAPYCNELMFRVMVAVRKILGRVHYSEAAKAAASCVRDEGEEREEEGRPGWKTRMMTVLETMRRSAELGGTNDIRIAAAMFFAAAKSVGCRGGWRCRSPLQPLMVLEVMLHTVSVSVKNARHITNSGAATADEDDCVGTTVQFPPPPSLQPLITRVKECYANAVARSTFDGDGGTLKRKLVASDDNDGGESLPKRVCVANGVEKTTPTKELSSGVIGGMTDADETNVQ
jgi:hypothetical protein